MIVNKDKKVKTFVSRFQLKKWKNDYILTILATNSVLYGSLVASGLFIGSPANKYSKNGNGGTIYTIYTEITYREPNLARVYKQLALVSVASEKN